MNDLYLVNKNYILNKSSYSKFRYISEYFNIIFATGFSFKYVKDIRIYCINSTRLFTICVKESDVSQETLNSINLSLLGIIQKESLYLDEKYMYNPLKEIFAKELLFI
jgi:hypothetical protein